MFWNSAFVKGFVEDQRRVLGGRPRSSGRQYAAGTMPRSPRPPADHSGKTEAGHTRDVKVERVGPVTIYRRGKTYYLYYREAA